MAEELRKGKLWDLYYDAAVSALFENYESVYGIDVNTSAYQCYHESASFQELQIDSSGEDFFAALADNIVRSIYPEDQAYVLKMLDRDRMLAGLKKDKYYSFVYRLLVDGKPLYHKVRATLEDVDGQPHVLLGIRNVDDTVRLEIAHSEKIASMYQKEKNHLEVILATAAGYMEANLTRDIVLELSPQFAFGEGFSASEFAAAAKRKSYSEMEDWLCREFVVESAEKYAAISSREYLLSCFSRGEKRTSVLFSTRSANGAQPQPCRKMFYLYQDQASGDVFSFSVIYDLTEDQRKEVEMEKLEAELRMSRIHNSTSQMQPHFLYNALGSIQEIVLDDPQYASELIGDFTTHLRSCIRAIASDAPLPFSQELDNIRAYINIEKMRFGEKLKIKYDIAADNFLVLPLTIQPLVENAIRHGIYQRGIAGGTVSIRSRETADAWMIEVEDDGVGFDLAAYRRELAAGRIDSTGLKNIIFRLDKVMHGTVDIISTVGEGTKVTVTLPKGGISQ